VGARGILLNLFDMMGNGVVDEYGYADMLARTKPFLSAITESRLQMSQIRGVQVLVNQNSAATIHTEFAPGAIRGGVTPGAPVHSDERVEPADLLPQETHWASLLGMYGFSTKITPWTADSEFSKQTLAISGQFLRNLDDAAVRKLLSSNRVLLDGDSVQVLLDRNLAGLLHVRSATWQPVRSGHQTYMDSPQRTLAGVRAARTSLLQHVGDYLNLDYEDGANVVTWSVARNQLGDELGPVVTAIDGHIFVLPLNSDPKYGWEAHYNSFEQDLFQKLLLENGGADYLVKMPNVMFMDTGKTLWLGNFSLDGYTEIRWQPGRSVSAKTATVKTRTASGFTELSVPITRDWAHLVVHAALGALETMQIQL
jgi:hypothetical protein